MREKNNHSNPLAICENYIRIAHITTKKNQTAAKTLHHGNGDSVRQATKQKQKKTAQHNTIGSASLATTNLPGRQTKGAS